MRKLLISIFVLLSCHPSLAQTWQVMEPGFPVWGSPGEEVLVRVSGPTGAQAKLGDAPLFESEPGLYFGSFTIPSNEQALNLTSDTGTLSLGLAGPFPAPQWFQAEQETVTRQGPNPEYDRLTPLFPGTRVAIDGRRGDWYRCRESGTWLDGRGQKAPVKGSLPPNRLQRVLVTEAPNGDALLTLQCVYPPEVQVVTGPKEGSLRLVNVLQTAFDIRRPSRVATFLGPLLLRPRTAPLGIDLDLSSTEIVGYQLEPRPETGELVVRIRKPLPRTLKGLKLTVDAGHGGPTDPGTVGHGGTEEQAVNLRVAEELVEMLRAAGAEVVVTRTSDSAVAGPEDGDANELQARIDLSVEAESQLFLSLHHNARPDIEHGKRSHGTDVYWYQPFGQPLAKNLADPIADAIGETERTFRWRSFYVIRQTYAPAVLIEFQYLSNPDLERNVLTRPDYPARAARGVVDGLKRYLEERPVP